MSMYVRQSNEDGTYTENKVYSEEDMMSFAEYCSHQFNVCDSFSNWYHEWGEKEDTKTTQQLLKEWEEQK